MCIYELRNLGDNNVFQFHLFNTEEDELVARSKKISGMVKHILEEIPDLAEEIAHSRSRSCDIQLIDFSPSLEEEFYETMFGQFTLANVDGLIDYKE